MTPPNPPQTEVRDLAPTQPADTRLSDPVTRVLDSLAIQWCNVPADSEEAEAMLMASVGQPSMKAEDCFGIPLSMVAVLIRTVNLLDETTGEVTPRPQTVILMKGGETVSFFSYGILESISVLASRRKRGVWDPPIDVTLKQIPCKNAHKRYVLQRVVPALSSPPKKGSK